MSTLPVIVYGNGDVFREYFNAIVTCFGTDGYSSLIRISITLALATVVYSYILKRDPIVLGKWFMLYYVVMYILFLPKVSIEIIDRVNQGHVYNVANVPLGLGVLASVTSAVGDELTQITEMNFTMPDDLHYAQTGMVMASRMVIAASQFQITDPAFSKNMQSFMNQCVFYDLLLNKYSVEDLMTSNNIWQFVSLHASPARAFMYNGQVTTCQKGIQGLNQDWKVAVNKAMGNYSVRLFPNSNNAKAQLIKYLPISYGYLTNLSDDSSQLMQQNLMANAIQNGIVHMGAAVNAPAALESYAIERAQDQKRLQDRTIGEMAAYWLPLVKNAFEAILFGSFVFIVLLALLPIGPTILKNYVYSLMFLQLWAPLYAVINLMCSYYAQTQSLALSSGIGEASLKSIPGLLQINQDMASLAGYLSLSVPALATGLVFGMNQAFNSLAHYVGGAVQSTAAAGAQEAATGSFSLGNTNFNNHHAFNTAANHVDTNARAFSGMFSTQMDGGSTLGLTPDGSMVMDSRAALSNLGTSINLADSIRTVASQQAEASYTAASNDAKSYGESMSSAMRGLSELSSHSGHSTTSGDTWSYSTNASVSEAMNNVHRLTERFAHDHNLSYNEASKVLNAYYENATLTGNIKSGNSVAGRVFSSLTGISGEANLTGGQKYEKDFDSGHSTSETFAAAKDFVRDSNYSQSVDTVLRATQDHSLRSGSEEGQRVINNIGSSFDKATAARQDMSSNFQQAESYREMASVAQENAININSNASQPFLEWLAKQPGTNGRGAMGMRAAESVLTDPELARGYASSFSQGYAKSMLSNWGSHLPHSQQAVHKAYEQNNHTVLGEGSVQSSVNNNQDILQASINTSGVVQKSAIDSTIRPATEALVKGSQSEINRNETFSKSHENKIVTEVKEAQDK